MASHTQVLVESLEAAGPLEGISDDEKRPALSHNGECPSHGTYLFVYVFPFHFGTVLWLGEFGKSRRKKKAQSADWALRTTGRDYPN